MKIATGGDAREFFDQGTCGIFAGRPGLIDMGNNNTGIGFRGGLYGKEHTMGNKRLLTILAAAGSAAVIGLGPVYAQEDESDELRLSSEEYAQIAAADDEFGFSIDEESSQIAALESDEFGLDEESAQIAALESDELALSEDAQVAALETGSSEEEGLAGRAGLDDESSVGGTMDSIEGAIGGSIEGEGHWNVQVPSGGGLIDD